MKTKKKRTIITEPRHLIGCRVDEATYARLVKYATENRVRLATLFRQILPEWLEARGY